MPDPTPFIPSTAAIPSNIQHLNTQDLQMASPHSQLSMVSEQAEPLPETSTTPLQSPPLRNILQMPAQAVQSLSTSHPTSPALQQACSTASIQTPTRTMPGAMPITPILMPETPELQEHLYTPATPARPSITQQQDDIQAAVHMRFLQQLMTQDAEAMDIDTNPSPPLLDLHPQPW